jgi:hypothetical protein
MLRGATGCQDQRWFGLSKEEDRMINRHLIGTEGNCARLNNAPLRTVTKKNSKPVFSPAYIRSGAEVIKRCGSAVLSS